MEFFKEWSLCICIALIISSVFSIFTPQGSMKRLWKIMISFFVFVSFIYPFKDFDANAFKLDTKSGFVSVEENANEAFEKQISTQIKEFLSSKEIVGASVSCSARLNSKSGELEIKEVSVFVPDEYEKEYVKTLIFNELGINSRVVYLGE